MHSRIRPPSHRNWEMDLLSSLMISFQRDSTQVLEKNNPRLQNWKEAFKKIHTLKGQRKNLQL